MNVNELIVDCVPNVCRIGENEMIIGLPANLRLTSEAKIPQTYAVAKKALEHCSRVDECKDWADKAEALASYARQADDSDLRKLADRIQARAIRRCGELLKEIAPKDTAGGDHRNGSVTMTRTHAAKDAGLSTRQKRTALRVANVPAKEFEEAIESDEPPTVTKLAERGKKSAPKSLLDLKGRNPKEFALSTQAQGELRRCAEMTKEISAEVAIRGAFDDERKQMVALALGKGGHKV
jgi:hypothetical protein